MKICKKDKKTIALDFDGVLHTYESGWNGPMPKDPPVKGSQEFVQKLIDKKYEVVIFSTRANTKKGKEGIEKWLKENNFPKLKVTNKKAHAEVYVDDRAINFKGNFKNILEKIEKFKSWTKKN